MRPKLTPKQREALEWLAASEGWTAAWWGGKPHGRWPQQMPSQTYNSLALAKLVETVRRERFDMLIKITQAGREALG